MKGSFPPRLFNMMLGQMCVGEFKAMVTHIKKEDAKAK